MVKKRFFSVSANGSSSSTIHELEIVPSATTPVLPAIDGIASFTKNLENNESSHSVSVPVVVSAKYDVGNVIGDGKW